MFTLRKINFNHNTSFFINFFSSTNNSFAAQILDGKKLARNILLKVKHEIEDWKKLDHRNPHLTAILVGNNTASQIYVDKKIKAANELGITHKTIKLESNITESELLNIIQSLNDDTKVDGILVQQPLPNQIDERNVCDAINPYKDIDGFNYINLGKMFLNDEDGLLPCTALGVIELIKSYGIETKGKHAVICGRSKNVGLPIALLLQADSTKTYWGCDTTVTICNRNTPKEVLKNVVSSSDIVVSACGVPGLITGNMVKKNACVIDVGINRVKDVNGKDKIIGDVNFKDVLEVAQFITPVPGGIGPLTVAMLMKNTLKAMKLSYLKKQVNYSC